MPKDNITRRHENKTTEAQTQKAILQWLAAEKIWHERRNTGAMVGEYNGRKRFTRFSRPGTADIFCTPWLSQDVNAGEYEVSVIKPCWIECKSPTGKQSQAQFEFEQEVKAAGHIYILARSLNDVISVLQ